jgi:DNA-binding transcriptional ArsR family regulator
MTLLEAVAQPQRQQILRTVWKREVSAGDIARQFDITFGAVSQHLAVLKAAGAVTVRKEGRQRFYRADQAALGPLSDYLNAMWTPRLRKLAALAEAEERKRA